MIKTINGIQYNVDVISQMTFEEFRSTCIGWTEDKVKNIYELITGKKLESVKIEKEKINKKKEIKTEIAPDVKEES